MIALETNALLRYLVDDESAPEQCALVRADVSGALHGGEAVFLPTVAIVETVWVLSRRVKSPKPEVIAALRDLAAIPGIVLEQPGTVQRALSMWEQGPADFADYVQLDVARSAGARSLVTFDRDLLESEDTRAPARR